MRKKIHLRKKKNKSYILLIVILIIISVLIILLKFNKKAFPIISNYAKTEAKNITAEIINKTLNENTIKKYNLNDLIIIKKNLDNEIESVDFDSVMANKILIESTNDIEKNIKNINKTNLKLFEKYDLKNDNGLVFFVPFGVIFNNTVLANIGPKIPIRINIIGNIVSQLESKIKDYGINNSLIELDIAFEVSMQVILPVKSEIVTIKNNSPIAFKVIQGKIPSTYLNNGKIISTIYISTDN